MTDGIIDRLRALLGPVGVSRDPDGMPRAVPESADAVAAVLGIAHGSGWRVRIEGRSSWMPPDAPADLALSTRALDQVVSVEPADLVATVQAGATIETVRRQLADHGMWPALDPPGRTERTLGSIAATATAGPLRLGYGPVRDQLLGCTVVTGDGRVVSAGGRVVKNVAGYDLTKLQAGGFGAFGVITEIHLRLRALPRADLTLVARGQRDQLTSASRDARAAGSLPAALELFSPSLASDPAWVLAARFLGAHEVAAAEARQFTARTGLAWQEVQAEKAGSFWALAARAPLSLPTTIRAGALLEGIDETIDLVTQHLGEGLIAAGAGNGLVRWSGEATVEGLRTLRRILAAREIPVTIERASWPLRQAVGHFGAYREGVGQLVHRLRAAFDPARRISVALDDHAA